MTIRIGSHHLVPPVTVALWLGLLVAERLTSDSFVAAVSAGLVPAPLALLALLVFLAIRLNQTLPACAGICAAALAYLPSLGFDRGVVGAGCGLAMVVIFIMGENGVIDVRSAVQGALSLLVPTLAMLVGRVPSVLAAADARLIALPPGLTFPQPAALLLLLAGGAMAARMRGGSGFFAYAALWSLAPLGAGLAASSAAERHLGFLAAILVMLYGVYRLYWQRVYLDELTGIPGRRAFEESRNRLFGSFAVAMADVDHFKSFNDTWGHPEGDNVLRWVAGHLRAASGSTRGVSAFRYGGEEFALLFRGSSTPRAAEIADSLRASIASAAFSIRATPRPADAAPAAERTGKRSRGRPHKRTEKVTVTVSMGVAWSGPELRGAKEVLRAADQALYRAKEEGRNRVASANPQEGPPTH